jgi:hypothetical protein
MLNSKTFALALVTTLAVSLTACSDLLRDLDQTSDLTAPKQAAPAVAKSEPTHPDVPPHLVACATATGIKTPSGAAKAAKEPVSADVKVEALRKASEERRKCALAILSWYKTIQAANKKAEAAQKPAG